MAIINVPSAGGSFWDNMTQTMLQTMIQSQQMELQKEQLKLQKGALKLEQEKAAAEAQQRQADIAAALGMLGGRPGTAQIFSQLLPGAQQGGGAQFTPATQAPLGGAAAGGFTPVPNAPQPGAPGVQIPRAAQTQLQDNPAAAPALLAQLRAQEESRSLVRQRDAAARGAEIEADISAATADARIETANLGPALANAEIENLRAVTRGRHLANAYQHLLNTRDPQRVAQARTLWETGQVTWEQAREATGLAEGGIPDNSVFVPPAGAQRSAEASKAAGFAQMMQSANGIMNELNAQGVRLSFLPSLMRSTKSPTFDAIANMITSPEQQRLVVAQKMFGDAYRFSLSGQQSSDREALRMMTSITEQVGDSEATIAQKRVLRETMINVTRLRAEGALSPVQGAQMGLRAAQNTGNEDTIELFEGILQQAIEEQSSTGGPSAAPTDSTNIVPRLQDIDDIIDVGFGVSGRRQR